MRPPPLGPIATSSLETVAVYGVRLLIQLALLFLIARYLGPEQYGQFAAVAALALGLGALSSFGLGFLVLGESAKSPQRGQSVLAQAVLATLISATVLGPLYLWFCRHVLGSAATIQDLTLIGISELLLVPLLGLVSSRLHGLGQVARSQMFAVLPMGLRLAGTIACMMLLPSAGLSAYALVHVAGAAAGLGLALALMGSRAREFVRWARIAPNNLKQGARYAVMNFMAINPSEADKALALRLLGASDTGLYALASRGMAVVTLPVVAVVLSAQPRLFRDADTHSGSKGPLIGIVIASAFGYGIAAAALLYWVAPIILQLALGASYAGIGEVVATIALVAPFMSVRFATGGIFIALGQPLVRAAIESGALLLLVALALVLVPDHGVHGMVWAVLTSEAAMAGASLVALLRRWRWSSPSEGAVSALEHGRKSRRR